MRLEWIEDLLAVLDAGSFTQAAEKRFLTQSAFTRRLQAIEAALGTELFDRSSRPAQLLPHVKEQEADLRKAAARLHALKYNLSHPQIQPEQIVSFACQHTIATTISPGLIRNLTRDGQLNVRVRSSDRDTCLMLLLTSQVDFALIFQSIGESQDNSLSGLMEEELGGDWMIPVIASNYLPVFNEAMQSQTLPIISYPINAYLGGLFEQHFVAQLPPRFQIARTAETGLTLAALHYTLEGIGIGWLPRSIAAADIERNRLMDLSARLPALELRVKIIRVSDTLSDMAERAWNQIASEYQRLATLHSPPEQPE